MKFQALSSQNNLQQIIASSQLNPVISGALPEISNLKHTLRRVRQRNDCAPPNPQSLLNLQIPERYTLTKDGR
ncbi:Chromo domain-containing protein [Aphis craccivora]|uniref:Chromo domain-containing protein n=1 Tax=Aphis craccivora TaxID=307492 RepID=A0A6G0YJ25_APHCR|nr:Chromo domain-containing protein [Aphis craccivora]